MKKGIISLLVALFVAATTGCGALEDKTQSTAQSVNGTYYHYLDESEAENENVSEGVEWDPYEDTWYITLNSGAFTMADGREEEETTEVEGAYQIRAKVITFQWQDENMRDKSLVGSIFDGVIYLDGEYYCKEGYTPDDI